MKRPSHHDNIHALADQVRRLSLLLTRERGELPSDYLKEKGLREAYCAYFLPPNRQKVKLLLDELALLPDSGLDKRNIRVLDLGSGPGSALLGVADFFKTLRTKPSLDCTAVDRVPENLNIGRELFMQSANEHALTAIFRTVTAKIEQTLEQSFGVFDLIILANVVNELFAHEGRKNEKRLVVLRNLIERSLAEDGTCLIIEPALRETSRDLLFLRDALIAGGITVSAPCLCRTSCPALVPPKDWCHEDVMWNTPDRIKGIDKLVGLRKDSLKFSYLLLRKNGQTLSDVYGASAFRVVSEPLVSKGKMEFYLCNDAGRRLATRLDKDATPENKPFGMLQRGAIISFESLIDEERRYRIGKTTRVEILRNGMPRA